MAERRLKSLEKKFENNPEMKQKYAESIRDDVEKGYVKKHRYVINPKEPNCLRRVYDSSAKFMGQSLNDKIFTGLNLLPSLFGLMLRICEGRIAMDADVKENQQTRNRACTSSKEQCLEKFQRHPGRTTQ